MNAVKTPEELVVMREGGGKIGAILQKLLTQTQPGANLLDIEKSAADLIASSGGTPSFLTVAGYKWATCLCVNDVVVHGIPKDYILKDGDILTIDVGLLYKDLHTDTAWTKLITHQPINPSTHHAFDDKERFLKTGEEALWKAMREAKVGNRVGHISQVIQEAVEGAGYGVVKTLVGHGVGRQLHEAPQVPGYLKQPVDQTLELARGMTLAIEVIYAMGSGVIEYSNADGWTLSSKDRSLTAVFEHTVAVTDADPEVLTTWPG